VAVSGRRIYRTFIKPQVFNKWSKSGTRAVPFYGAEDAKRPGKGFFSIFLVAPVYGPSPSDHQGVPIDTQGAPWLPDVGQNARRPASMGLPTRGRTSRIGPQAAVISELRQNIYG
jgi:hypothetical protein